MPVVAGAAGPGPHNPGPCKVIIQVSPEAGLVESSQNQPVILTQAPLNWGTAEAPTAVAGHPAPLYLVSSGSGTLTQWVCGDSGPAATWSQSPPKSSRNPNSVYENFRRWQRFKALARRYLPQTPDTEALSCFFIPVLRTLARLKPTMSLEEGLHRALQEWQGKSNYDRMIYYDMAAKFMEFEAEEEMEVQKLQWTNGVQGLPLPAPPRPGPQGAPGPRVPSHPSLLPSSSACVPKKARPQARAARPKTHKPQQPPKTKAPEEIPPEAVQEYMDIMDELLKAPDSVCRAPLGQQAVDREEQQEEAGTCPDPGLLSYVYELCSQEAFVTKAEAILHPSFLEYLVSPESQLDFPALAEELEEEEGLTPAQLVEKRLQTLQDKEVMKARPQHQVSLKDSSPAESAAGGTLALTKWRHSEVGQANRIHSESQVGHSTEQMLVVLYVPKIQILVTAPPKPIGTAN
ncbi:NUT family member 2G-like [Sorex fumeus]|uniref:NUT family member 2G-like n=1 Tax=Sorex fumeus TaxID=62283 RepID=UPI0024AE59B1|nr:NUT family member 2G-like [Sorex fumeus]